MDDFASATMLRLLLGAMRRRGMRLPMIPPAGSLASLASKRAVLLSAVAQSGPAMLIELARDIDVVRDEPIHQALACADDPLDLIRRWQRLEQYVHSAHRVAVLDFDRSQAELAHVPRTAAGAAPHPFENLVVLGVLIGAVESLGLGPVQAEIDGVPVHPQPDAARLSDLVGAARTGRWRLRWDDRPADRRGAARQAQCPPPDLCDTLPWPELARRIARSVLADPGAPQRLADTARTLALAPRSLQRTLARYRLSFTAVVAEARTRAAAWWLINSSIELAEVGFVCGFSDQPHFTRDFQRRTGITPARYRQMGNGRGDRMPVRESAGLALAW
ncbi:helix-turn-helix transcriptional regulator [Derxia lacustris]|uniref:helix-turn-helix transcriptional regulator n=1 Tax=Derxia lacustris TaxID=764842 RepID=UPI00159493FF|nr:helix-turn-helix transcriptional regulator [Derxia lacustris]